MAEKTRIVGSDDKGQFNVPVPRASIERVDIIDLDMVLQTKDGSRLILPGAAIDAMGPKPPSVSFPDGRVGAIDLLSSVGKVETPPSSIPAMTSLTQFDQKLTQGKKNRTDDAADKQAEQAQAQQVAPLPVGAGQSSVDDLMNKAEKLLEETRNKAFDPAPAQIHQTPAQTSDAPGSQPQTAKIPLYVSLAEGNVVNVTTTAVSDTLTVSGVTRTYTTAISGSGGPTGSGVASGIQPTDTLQYGTETLTGTSGNDVIYADGFAGLGSYRNTQATYADLNVDTGIPNSAGTHFYYAKEIMLTLAGYIRTINSISISDLPAGVVALVIGGTTYAVTNGSVGIPSSAVVPTALAMTLIYDLSAVTNGVYDIKVNISGQGVDPINISRTFKLQLEAVAAAADITGNSPIYVPGSGWSDYYVLETASSPHTINAGAGDDLVYGGNSADTVSGGDGNDIILTYAGNDIIDGGNGANIIWAGAGNDHIIGGADADDIRAGSGDDILYGGAGNNVSLDGGAGTDWLSFNGVNASQLNSTLTATQALEKWLAFAGTTFSSVTFTADATGGGTATHVSGGVTQTSTVANVEHLIGSQGNDTLNMAAYTGISHTLYGLDGDDVLTGSDNADILYGGAGQDSILGGAGNDLIFTAITSTGTTTDATALTGTNSDGSGGGLTRGVITGIMNIVDGGDGADTIVGGAGNDYFISGNNQYADASGAYDTFIGGAGLDTVDHSAFTANLVIDLGNNLGRINGGAYIASYSSIERILTGSGNDTITGTINDEIFYAGNGTNYVTVGGGADTAYGGTGTDYFYSAVGAKNSANQDNSAYYDGGGGYNEYSLRAGVETIVGTSGTDRIFYNNSAATALSGVNYGVFVNLDSTNWVVSNTGALTTTAGTSYWYDGTTWSTAMTGDTSSSAQRGYYGDANNDKYIGTVEQIYGSNYNDVLIGNAADNWFFGYGGADAMYGMAGADTFAMMYGGTSNSGTDYINGGNDVAGTPDSYTLTANTNGTLSLSIVGGDGVDFSSGNVINRSLVINLDTVAHNETSTNNGTGTGTGTSYAANQVSGWVNTVTLVDIERATGGNYADILYGSAADNVLSGGAGNDSLWGFDGNDFLNGGTGSNYLNGGAGNDWASYYGMTVGVEVYLADADLDGNGVNDQAGDAANWGTSNQARFTGQNGKDFDKLINIENIEGSDYADRIAGDANDNSLFGGAGADTIFGGAGNDVINGGSGDDTIEGGAGADVLTGGTGNDTLSYATSSAGVTVDLSANTATGGDATGDTISGFEYLRGSAHADTLTGNSSTNIIYGLDGNDVINGNGGADTLYGGNGNDTIVTTSAIAGNSGTAYSFDGGAGTDTLTAANWTLSNLSVSKLTSIEVLDLRGASTITTSALDVTKIAGILDSASGNTLTIYLDSGDTFTTTNANVTTSAANDGQGHTGTHYTYASGGSTYYVDVYKV